MPVIFNLFVKVFVELLAAPIKFRLKSRDTCFFELLHTLLLIKHCFELPLLKALFVPILPALVYFGLERILKSGFLLHRLSYLVSCSLSLLDLLSDLRIELLPVDLLPPILALHLLDNYVLLRFLLVLLFLLQIV